MDRIQADEPSRGSPIRVVPDGTTHTPGRRAEEEAAVFRREKLSVAKHEQAVAEAVRAKKAADHQSEKYAAELRDLIENQETRKTYATRCFVLVVVWLSLIIVLAILNGSPKDCPLSLTISDPVLCSLIGGCTAQVVAMTLVVLRWLYPQSAPRSKK